MTALQRSASATALCLETPPRATEGPIDPAAGHGDAGDLPAKMLLEDRLPGHEAEAVTVVDHGELAAAEIADQRV